MTGDCHVPFCGSPGVQFPGATRRTVAGPQSKPDGSRPGLLSPLPRWPECRAQIVEAAAHRAGVEQVLHHRET